MTDAKSLQGKRHVVEALAPWPDSVDGAALLGRLDALITTYVRLPIGAAQVVALWVLLTYVFNHFSVLPILLISAPDKGCGKTTLLSVLKRLCFRAVPASNLTSAVLFRVTDRDQPTLLIDEADTFLVKNEELRGIVNSGHTREMGITWRIEGESREARAFRTYCPKAIAGIGKQAPTIEDRSLKVPLQRKKEGDRVPRLAPTDDWVDVRRKCLRWATDNGVALEQFRPVMPSFLQNRAADNWEPLFAIALMAGPEWFVRVSSAALVLASNRDDKSDGELLLGDIRRCFAESKKVRVPTEELIGLLSTHGEPVWAVFGSAGQPITPAEIARLLRPFGIEPKSIRLPDGRTPKGYDLVQFQEAFARYLPQAATTPQAGGGVAG